MPEEIVTRILRLPAYGIYRWETDEVANTLILSIRQTAGELPSRLEPVEFPGRRHRRLPYRIRGSHPWPPRRRLLRLPLLSLNQLHCTCDQTTQARVLGAQARRVGFGA